MNSFRIAILLVAFADLASAQQPNVPALGAPPSPTAPLTGRASDQQPSASKIVFAKVDSVLSVGANRYQAILVQQNGAKVRVECDAQGKAFLDTAVKKRERWEKLEKAYREALARGPEVKVKKEHRSDQDGGWGQVVTDVTAVNPTEPPPAPSFTVYSLDRKGGACPVLLGSQEHSSGALGTTYGW